MKTVRMGEMTVRDVESYLEHNQTIILPYGVVEQHGHHLPLDTDIRIAATISEKIAEQLPCIVAPSLNYCFSGGMLKGTINIKPNTFAMMVGEIIESLAIQGFKNIFIIPGHGGSESLFLLKESLRILKWLNPALADVLIALTPPWDFSETNLNGFKTRDYHAGEIESAELLAWYPEIVREKIVMDIPEIAEALRMDPDSYQERTALTDSPQEIMQTRQKSSVKIGVMGYPERATAETGRKLESEILATSIPAMKKMIAMADENRKSGKRITIPTPEELRILSL